MGAKHAILPPRRTDIAVDPKAKWSLVRERTNDATAELLLLLLLIVLLVMTFEELG